MLTKRELLRSAALTAAAIATTRAIPALAQTQTGVTPAEARAIAKEAYIYGFPMVDSYRIQHAYFIDSESKEFKAPWNQIANIPRVFTHEDRAVQTPNSDTPYSWLGLDLRAEPIVLTVPPIEKERYYSVMLNDAYTFNFDYLGSRTTGNEGGSYAVAGPNWKGETPKGVKKVIRSETELNLLLYRVQLFSPDDLDNVKKVQAGFKVQPLSAFLGTAAPKAAPAIDFIKPLTPAAQRTSPEFFNVLNFVLQFCSIHPSETELMARFARIGVGAGKVFDATKLSPEIRTAITQGMADAWGEFDSFLNQINAGKVFTRDLPSSRADTKGYMYRLATAVLGIYGNSKEDAIYLLYNQDAAGQKLDGANRYTLRFAPGELPPVNAFWSLTMYDSPASLMVANPINRYLVNSPMLSQFKKDADGGITILIQNESPGADKEANWLPAPKGPFLTWLRLYWPKAEALDGRWKQPPLTRTT
jgi:hypothetical protein